MEPDIMERIAKAVRDREDERRPAEVVTLGRAEQAALRAVVTEVGFSMDTPLVGLLYGMRINLVDEPTRLTIDAEADHAT
jgi:hypothetical protein